MLTYRTDRLGCVRSQKDCTQRAKQSRRPNSGRTNLEKLADSLHVQADRLNNRADGHIDCLGDEANRLDDDEANVVDSRTNGLGCLERQTDFSTGTKTRQSRHLKRPSEHLDSLPKQMNESFGQRGRKFCYLDRQCGIKMINEKVYPNRKNTVPIRKYDGCAIPVCRCVQRRPDFDLISHRV